MKKSITFGVVVLMIAVLAGCSPAASTAPTASSTPKPTPTPVVYLSAPEIVEKLKKAGLPIVHEVTYTEENDVNGLLGRPGQYTAKTNFIDKRHIDEYNTTKEIMGDAFDPLEWTDQGMLETFDSKADMQKRLNYVSALNEGGGILGNYYIYHSDRAILRLDYVITPKEAEKYAAAFYEITGTTPSTATP